MQADFSVPFKLKIIMNCSDKLSIYNYINKNNLVEKKQPVSKEPSFNRGYGEILIEILEFLDGRVKNNKLHNLKYNKKELNDIILKYLNLSEKYQELLKESIKENFYHEFIYNKEIENICNFSEEEKTYIIKRVELRNIRKVKSIIGIYLNLIFENTIKEKISINQMLNISRQYQDNYYYNN